MNQKKAVFLVSNNGTLNLKETKSLKKRYKRSSIDVVDVIDINKEITILTFEELLIKHNLNINNIDFITDRLDLILTVFRVYQKQIQSFVYIENGFTLEKSDGEPIILQQLLEKFDGIESEEIHKKIYVNLNDSNYISVIGNFLNQLDYISVITNFEILLEQRENLIKNKYYWLNEQDNIFIDFESNETENIYLNIQRLEPIKRFNNIVQTSDISIIAYYIMYKMKNYGTKEYLSDLNELSNTLNGEFFKVFEKKLIDLISASDFTPESKITLYQLIFDYQEEFHNELYNKIIKLVYSNEVNWKYWKSLVTMFYRFKFSKEMVISDDVYKTTKEVNIALSEIIEKQLNHTYEVKKEEDNKKVVILIDQLLTLFHSPTNVLKVQLDQLLLKTDYEYHIVIEENMIQPKDEYVLGLQKFVGNESTFTVEKFKELFQTDRVNLYLVNKDLDITAKVKQILNTVFDINPKLIFSLSYLSTAQNLLYKYYPLINFSLGHEYLPAKAHLYLYKNDQRAIELSKRFKDKTIIKHYRQPAIQIPNTENYKRADLKYKDNDFIIITSGNRIENEIDDELIDLMHEVLNEHQNIKWLLVGSKIPTYLLQTYGKDILDNQIKHISYAKDLIALNRICDLSINPNRVGGGYSVSSCIEADIPVLMCTYESDGMSFLGRENTCGEQYEDLIACLLKCYNDSNYYEEMLNKQRPNINKRRVDNTEMLVQYFEEVEKMFNSL